MGALRNPMMLRSESLPSPAIRWTALVLISLAMFGSSYIYDCIGPLAKILADQLSFSDADIGLLQAVCSLPNIVMVLVGGLIIDRIGVQRAAMIFAVLCLLGAILTAASPRFSIMLVGRLLFGLGIGSLAVACTTGIAHWFTGENLSFAFGLNLTINRLGSLAAQVSPTWAPGAYATWRGPLVIAIGFAVVSVLAVAGYWLLENRYAPPVAPEPAASSQPNGATSAGMFTRAYWLAVLVCVTFYAGIFPFQTFAQKFFTEAHGAAPDHASLLVGALTVVAMVATPLFGLLADRIGRRTLLLVIGCGLLVPVYLLMAHTRIHLLVPMLMMGLAFSLVPAVLWPAVILMVPHARLGKAFGLMSMVQNVGLTAFNYLIGWANDWAGAGPSNPGGYRLGMWLFSATALVSLGFSLLLRLSELGPHRHGLEFPHGRKE